MIVEDPPQAPLEIAVGAPARAGVIEDARRRQRRGRALGGALASACALAGAFILGIGGGGRVITSDARPVSLTWLTGPRLRGPVNLRLVASENTGPASIVNLDDGRIRAVRGLGVPDRQGPRSPQLYPLAAAPGGALAVVTHQACATCRVTQRNFLIGPNGSVRLTSTISFAARGATTAPALDSTTRTWVLTESPNGRCTLSLAPSAGAGARTPCGTLGSDTPAGLTVTRGNAVWLVDPRTGRVDRRFTVHGQFDVVDRDLALTSVAPGIPGEGDAFPRSLALVNLVSGARRNLRWPSAVRFGYNVIPEPGGPLVAVEFADPTHSPGQVSDVWVLDTRTGTFTHVPGFPILEDLKFSGIAWTTDHRLVIVARGGRRTSIGIWRPGSRRLPVRRMPPLTGYSQIVPLTP